MIGPRLLLLALIVALSACKDDHATGTSAAPAQANPPAVTPASRPASMPAAAAAAPTSPADEADAIFASRCVTCHGRDGKGDGPASGALNPKPRSFADAEWQKSVTDEAIEKIVLLGGPSVGKSPLMPPNPDLDGKAAVVAALRAKVRGFSGK